MRYREFVTEFGFQNFIPDVFSKPQQAAGPEPDPDIPPGYRLFTIPKTGKTVAIPAQFTDQQALEKLKQQRPDLFTTTTGQAAKVTPATQLSNPKAKLAKPAMKKLGKIKLENTSLGSYLEEAAKAAGIAGVELAAFLAQCKVETANFTTLKEIGATKYFNRYDIKHNPKKAKELGNVNPGDGALFKGRGYIMLTGRYNYTDFAAESGIPVDKNPNILLDPATAARASIWFWKNKVRPNVANFKNTRSVTHPINKGLMHLNQRHSNFKNYYNILASAGQQPAVG